jgi:hypothetical protein
VTEPAPRVASAGRVGPAPVSAANFYDLGDAEKVKFSENETAATLAHLDKLLRDLDELGAGVDDPDGFVSLSLGFDGHLVEIEIADAVGKVMSNIELENRVNRLFAAGTEGVNGMRADLWESAVEQDSD